MWFFQNIASKDDGEQWDVLSNPGHLEYELTPNAFRARLEIIINIHPWNGDIIKNQIIIKDKVITSQLLDLSNNVGKNIIKPKKYIEKLLQINIDLDVRITYTNTGINVDTPHLNWKTWKYILIYPSDFSQNIIDNWPDTDPILYKREVFFSGLCLALHEVDVPSNKWSWSHSSSPYSDSTIAGLNALEY